MPATVAIAAMIHGSLRFLGKQITGWELPTGMRFGLPGVDRLSGCNRREKTGVLAMLPRSIKN
jgi:hypothetical protein